MNLKEVSSASFYYIKEMYSGFSLRFLVLGILWILASLYYYFINYLN